MVWSSTWNRFRWVSSKGSDFNFDYHVSFTEEDRSEGAEYNYVPSQSPEGLEEQGLSASLRTRTVRSSTPTPAMPGPTRTSSPPTSSSTSSPRDVTKRASSGPCNACGVTTSTAESGPPAGVASHVPGHSGRPGVRRGPLPTITGWCPRGIPDHPVSAVGPCSRALARRATDHRSERRRPSANRISRDRRLVGRLRSHRFGLRRSVLCARPEHGRLRRRGRREACCRTQPRTRRPAP